MMHRNRVLSSLTAAAALALAGPALADEGHSDIHFDVEGGQLIVEDYGWSGVLGPVYEAAWPTTGPEANWTVEPGFETHAGTVTAGATLSYDIHETPHGRLVFWDASTGDFAGTDATLTKEDSIGETVISAAAVNRIGGSTGVIGNALGDGSFHADPGRILSDGAASGAYGVLMSLSIDDAGVADSDPFWLVFNYGLDDTVFDEQAAPAFAAIPEPGTLALLGVGGFMLLRRRNGRA